MISQWGQSGGGNASPVFALDLLSSLSPRSSGGSSTPTFTRATTASSGGYAAAATVATSPLVLSSATGIARFVGARQVDASTWSSNDANGVFLSTTNGASSLYGDASGPLGYLAEGVRINAALQSQTLDNASWQLSSATNMNAVAADQYVAPDGTTTADKMQPKATNAQHYIFQTFTTSAIPYTLSLYVKYVNSRWMAIDLYDGTNNNAASFDILNGVPGAVSAGVTSTISATALTGVYRVSLTVTPLASAGSLIVIAMNNSDIANAQSWAAAGTEVMGVWGAQIEAASFASTYIPTTTIAVQRNADVDQYVSSGNIASTMSGTMQVTPTQTFGTFTGFIFATYVDASNYTAVLFDGTNLIARKRISGTNHDATIAWTPTIATLAKIGWRFDAVNGSDIWLNGTKGTTDATTTAAQIGTNFQIGADGNSLNQDFCEHRLLNVYPVSLSDAQMSAKTT